MKKSTRRTDAGAVFAALLIMAAFCILFTACTGPASEGPATDKAAEATPTAKITAVPTELPTEAPPTEVPTATPVPEPTEYPYEGMPEPYFDLLFKDKDVYDALDNVEPVMEGGEVGEFKVNLDGKEVTVPGFFGSDDDSYITLNLTEYDISFADFVSEGVTYEIFIQLKDVPDAGGGMLISNGNGGGTNMAIRGSEGQINFNVGCTTQDGTYCGSGYVYAQTNDASQGAKIENGKLVHVVGVYDVENGEVRLYYNGELMSSGNYGSGEFNMASTRNGVLGVAYNASYPSERLGKLTDFTIVKARGYRQALTNEEVKAIYDNCIAAVTPSES